MAFIIIVNGVPSQSLSLDKICRICLADGELFSIHSKLIGKEESLCQILTSCGFIRFSEFDNLPKQVCSKCIKYVKRLLDFKEVCESSEVYLHKYIQSLIKPNNGTLQTLANIPKTAHKTKNTPNYETCTIGIKKEITTVSESKKYLTCVTDIKYEDNIKNQIEPEITEDMNNEELRKDFFNEDDNETQSDNLEPKTVSEENEESNEHVTFKKKSTLLKVQAKVENGKVKCLICNLTFPSKFALIEHRRSVKHPQRRFYTCGFCSKTIPGGQAKKHMSQYHKHLLRKYPCDLCDKKFDSIGNARRHRIIHTGDRPFQCEICSKTFTRGHYLNDHRRLHTGDAPYECKFCAKTFSIYAKYFHHMKLHDTKKNECEVCNEQFENYELLMNHLKIHQDDDSLMCKECGTKFNAFQQYKMHMKKQHPNLNDEKSEDSMSPHVCDFCQLEFKTKSILKQHMSTHGEKNFLCNECGKSFRGRNGLNTHMRTHSEERPYKCDKCDKSFPQKFNLKIHMLTHTELRRYQCTVCDKAFKLPTHRNRHMLVHTGQRPHSCPICSKAFAQKQNFVVHMRMHTGEKPYVCSVCGKSFSDGSTMNKHKKTHV